VWVVVVVYHSIAKDIEDVNIMEYMDKSVDEVMRVEMRECKFLELAKQCLKKWIDRL
jgi:hypothetical protein